MKTKKLKASVLIMSLLIMFAIVIITLSATLVSVRDRKISIGSGKSSRAFQTAQGGIEKALKVIIDLDGVDPVTLVSSGGFGGGCNSSSKLIEQTDYNIELKDKDGVRIDCDSPTATIADITSVKVVGREGTTENRAIEAAVAAQNTPGVTGGCAAKQDGVGGTWDIIDSSNWGDGCTTTSSMADNPFNICENVQASGFECGMSSMSVFAGDGNIVCICTNED
jgi:hypothetical protein